MKGDDAQQDPPIAALTSGRVGEPQQVWSRRSSYAEPRDIYVVVKRERDGSEQINCIDYELGVLEVVREKLRCTELWLAGTNRLRNPDVDLPAGFAAQWTTY